MSSEKSEVQEGLTVKTLILGLIIVFIVAFFWSTFMQLGPDWNRRIMSQNVHYPLGVRDGEYSRRGTPYLTGMGVLTATFLLIGLINKIKPGTFKKAELVMLFILLPMGALIAVSEEDPWMVLPGNIFTMGYISSADAKLILDNIVPPAWGWPKDPALYQAYAGWYPNPPWGVFSGFLAWMFLFYISGLLIWVFAGLLWRYLWIDVEDLKFPLSDVVQGIMDETGGVAKDPQHRGKLLFFTVGLLIQFLWHIAGHGYDVFFPFMVGDLTRYISAWGNSGFLWNTRIQICPHYEGTALAIFPWVGIHLQAEAWQVGWGYILPPEITIASLLGHFIFWWILPITWSGMGIFPVMATGRRTDDTDSMVQSYGAANGIIPAIWTGMFIALTFWPLWKNRRQIAPVIKSLWSKVDPRVEASSPLPYRYIWLGLIGSFIIFVGSQIAIGARAVTTIATYLSFLLVMPGAVRIALETGGPYMAMQVIQTGNRGGEWQFLAVGATYLTMPPTQTLENITAFTLSTSGVTSGATFYIMSIAIMLLLLGSRMAKDVNIKPRNIFTASVLSVIVAVIASGLGAFYWMSALNLRSASWPAGGYPGEWINYQWKTVWTNLGLGTYTWMRNFQPAWSTYLGRTIAMIAVGFVIIVAMFILRGRFVWFKLAPVGMALGTWGGSHAILLPFIIGLVFRWITMAVGARDFYENKAKPLCYGFLAGAFLSMALFAVLTIPPNIVGGLTLP